MLPTCAKQQCFRIHAKQTCECKLRNCWMVWRSMAMSEN